MDDNVSPDLPPPSERQLAAAAHLAAFAGAVVPLGHLLGPAVVWWLQRDQSSYVTEHARAALDFQITLTVALLCAIVLGLLLFLPTLGLGTLFLVFVGYGVWFVAQVLTVLAAIRAHGGRTFRYPLALRWL
jgi:uncharacterized Tic20 family protein